MLEEDFELPPSYLELLPIIFKEDSDALVAITPIFTISLLNIHSASNLLNAIKNIMHIISVDKDIPRTQH